MLNQSIIVGKVVSYDNENKVVVRVDRNYKNEEGCYDADYINVYLSEHLVQSAQEYVKKDVTLAIKGRLVSTDLIHALIFVGEKYSFLAGATE
jgi:single-stranded DNA-binding protein